VDYDSETFDLTPVLRHEVERLLAEAGAGLAVAQKRSEDEVARMAAGADLVMIQSTRPLLTRRVIEGLSSCRGIVRMGVGYDSVDLAAATAQGIPVSNVAGWCTDEVAEHTLALLLAGVRRLTQLDGRLHRGL
jgi:D-3-phosphoglycerate dehydrogenase